MFPTLRHDRRNTEPKIQDSFSKPTSLKHSYTTDKILNVHQRDELNEIAEFLMKQPPPPSNRMAGQSPSGEKRHTYIKHSAMKIFGRYRTKRMNDIEPFQLPDSAVNSKTLSGARHIAISIPNDQRTQIESRPRSSSEFRTVSTIQAVCESATPEKNSPGQPRDSTSSSISLRFEMRKKPSSVEFSVTSDCECQIKSQPKRRRETGTSRSTDKPSKENLMVPPYGKSGRLNSSPRAESISSHSSYSPLSYFKPRRTLQTHAISSRPTMDYNPLPERNPNRLCFPTSLDGVVQNFRVGKPPSIASIPSTPPKNGSESSSVSPLVFGTATAKLARSFSGARIEKAHIVRCSTPNLPLGPEMTMKSSSLPISRSSSPLSPSAFAEDSLLREHKSIFREMSWMASAQPFRYSVDDLKDLATAPGLTVSPCHMLSADTPVPSLAKYHPPKQSMCLSGVMTVANFAPDYDNSGGSVIDRTKRKCHRTSHSTLDLSLPNSSGCYGGDTDDSGKVPAYTFSGEPNIQSRDGPESTLDSRIGTHKQERQVQRNMALEERDLDSRLSKMERDNAILLSALNSIVKRFGEMSSF